MQKVPNEMYYDNGILFFDVRGEIMTDTMRAWAEIIH